uniref:Uncharacterized protein n=1 Tax=Glossina pallidipes TaxID=7398 RepID=A0A1B0AE60_GLOPL
MYPLLVPTVKYAQIQSQSKSISQKSQGVGRPRPAMNNSKYQFTYHILKETPYQIIRPQYKINVSLTLIQPDSHLKVLQVLSQSALYLAPKVIAFLLNSARSGFCMPLITKTIPSNN